MKTLFTIAALTAASIASANPYAEAELSLSDQYGADSSVAMNNMYGSVEAGYTWRPTSGLSVSAFARHNGLVSGDWYGSGRDHNELGASARFEFK